MGQVFNHVNFKVTSLPISADSLYYQMVMDLALERDIEASG